MDTPNSDIQSDDSFGSNDSPKVIRTSKKASTKSSKATKPKLNGKKNEQSAAGDDPLHVFESIEEATKGGKKKLSIESIYQKKSQLEHILLRPDTYIGSVDFIDKTISWVYDAHQEKIVNREIAYVPGLYKIFDEILVNAADNKQRDKKMSTIKVTINRDNNEVTIWNNGKGIPVVHHKVEKMYVPELIFGTLLTSSNYDDSERKVTGGRNGFGAKLCNIFSKKFTVETSCSEYKKAFKQTWTNNMQSSGEAKITTTTGDDFTKVTFQPDLSKFHMTELDDDIVDLMNRRAFDVAGTSRGVKVFLNGVKLPANGFKAYVEQYIRDRTDDQGSEPKIAYEMLSDRWEVAVTMSDRGFQHVSFVNSIATTKGGRHVDYIADQITSKLIETVRKKVGKNGLNIKPFQIRNHMWLFVNALIENPTFDSQTKENMTLQAKNFGSKCDLSDKFVQSTLKTTGIVEAIMAWVRFKQQEKLDKQCCNKKTSKLKGVPKLEDANDAGTKNSAKCTLIVTEGDSAKTMAVSGLSIVGRDRFGVFPLRGKMLNVREATHKQLMENAETGNLLKIVGLQYKRTYQSDEDFATLRYGKLMIMTDQDQDGSHIKGLIINFIHYNWPSLIRRDFIEQFITPIVKTTKGKEELSFYTIPEYIGWKQNTENWNKYRIKYYKGLGTSTAKEAKEYFSNMARHQIHFKYQDVNDDNALELAFSRKKIENRKDWLTDWMTERKRRRENDEPEDYLYAKETKRITYSEFINKELVLFSNTDNERSIPCLVDGLKPGQRKVLFTCLKRADKKEVKVAQLAGAVGEMSAYHHGETSLMSTIINLAHDFVGSNNINLLLPIGQFGTRLQGGKDSASPRYIFTMLNPVTRTLFPVDDNHVIRYLFEENQQIEPEWYCPILPTVLVNGAQGIGTGWSTNIPNYNPRDIVHNLHSLINDQQTTPMTPWFRNFRGSIQRLDNSRFVSSGEVSIVDENTVEITELPIKTWTQNYKETVIEPMLGTDKQPALITDFKEYHTDTTVKFVIKLLPGKLAQLEHEGLHKAFKLQTILNTTSMVLFDAEGCLQRFGTVEEILEKFFKVRKFKYIDRKRFLEGMLTAQSSRLSNQARFIVEKIKGTIVIENKKKRHIVDKLVKMKFDPDPVKKWKDEQKKKQLQDTGEIQQEEDEESADEALEGEANKELERRLSDYDYLVGMALIKLSEEEKDKLLKESDNKKNELLILQGKTWAQLWTEDLDAFLTALTADEEKQKLDLANVKVASTTTGRGAKKNFGTAKHPGMSEIRPSPHGQRIEPKIDPLLKQKFEKVDHVKQNKGKSRSKKDNNEEDTMTLLDRLSKKSPDLKRKLAKQKDKTNQQQSIAKFLTNDKQSGKKEPIKRKNEWNSDQSNETDDDIYFDEVNSIDSDSVPVVKNGPSNSKRRRKISDSSDDNEKSPDCFAVSSKKSDETKKTKDDDMPKVVSKPERAVRSRKTVKYVQIDDDEDEDQVQESINDSDFTVGNSD